MMFEGNQFNTDTRCAGKDGKMWTALSSSLLYGCESRNPFRDVCPETFKLWHCNLQE